MALHRVTEFRSCTIKTKYENRNKAIKKAQKSNSYYGDQLEVYSCSFCGKWHIGHPIGFDKRKK